MEKIQSALAKARAERSEKEQPAPEPELQPQPERRGNRTKSRIETFITERDTATPEAMKAAAAWDALPGLNLERKLMKRNRIVAYDGGRGASDIDMLRTRVLQQMRDNGWRRLAITSPTASCGKSTLALNLALSMQRQADVRTALLELDLRRPSLAKMVGIEEKNISFGQVLEGSGDFEDNALKYGNNLMISTNQRPWRNAAELLAGAHVSGALTSIEENYSPDVVIFDGPPMLATDDMMAFARRVDCVLLVAGAETTTVKELDVCERDLASQTNVMGVILNKCRYMGKEYGYYD